MSEEQLKAFLEKVKADTSLQEKLKAAADTKAVAAIAKKAGFSISADDLTKAQSELSEENWKVLRVATGLACSGFQCGGSLVVICVFITNKPPMPGTIERS